MGWPTTSDPRTEFVTLRLTAREAADLDAMAKASGNTRSATVRACVMQGITRAQKRARQKAALAESNDAGA